MGKIPPRLLRGGILTTRGSNPPSVAGLIESHEQGVRWTGPPHPAPAPRSHPAPGRPRPRRGEPAWKPSCADTGWPSPPLGVSPVPDELRRHGRSIPLLNNRVRITRTDGRQQFKRGDAQRRGNPEQGLHARVRDRSCFARRPAPRFDQLDLVLGDPGSMCQRFLREVGSAAEFPNTLTEGASCFHVPRHSSIVETRP